MDNGSKKVYMIKHLTDEEYEKYVKPFQVKREEHLKKLEEAKSEETQQPNCGTEDKSK